MKSPEPNREDPLELLRKSMEPQRESPKRAAIRLGIAAVVAAGLLGLYLWQAKRSHAVKVLIAEATPLIERGDLTSLRQAEKKLLEASDIKRNDRVVASLAETYAMQWVEHGMPEAKAKAQAVVAEAVNDDLQTAQRYAAEGLVAIGEGRFADAEKVASDIITRGGMSERLFWVLGLAELAQGKVESARDKLKRATDLKSSAPHYARALGDALEDDNDSRGASNYWELAAKVNPNYVQGVARDLYSRVRRGEPRATVLAEIKRLNAMPAEDVGPYGQAAIQYTLALITYQEGKNKEALAAVAAAEKTLGTRAYLTALRGQVLIADGKVAEGQKELAATAGRAPAADKYLYALVDALVDQGNTAEALKALQAHGAGRTNEARYHVALGDVYVAAKDFAKAKAEHDKALELEPDYPEAYLGQAIAQARQKKYQDAVALFEQALVVKPKFPEVYEAIGLMFIETGILPNANTQLDMSEKLFRAVDVDTPRLKRFYASVQKSFQAKGGYSYVKEWQAREKLFREGTQPALQ